MALLIAAAGSGDKVAKAQAVTEKKNEPKRDRKTEKKTADISTFRLNAESCVICPLT